MTNNLFTVTRHSVPLEDVPESFHVPPALEGRFRYDASRRELSFDGYMSASSYVRLRAVSRDYHYQRALERLFQMSVPEESSSEARPRRLVAVAKSLKNTLTSKFGTLVHHILT